MGTRTLISWSIVMVISPHRIANTARKTSGPTPGSQPIASSILWTAGTVTTTTIMPSEGRIQIEFVKLWQTRRR